MAANLHDFVLTNSKGEEVFKSVHLLCLPELNVYFLHCLNKYHVALKKNCQLNMHINENKGVFFIIDGIIEKYKCIPCYLSQVKGSEILTYDGAPVAYAACPIETVSVFPFISPLFRLPLNMLYILRSEQNVKLSVLNIFFHNVEGTGLKHFEP